MKAAILKEACGALSSDRCEEAAAIIRERYPFVPLANAGRRYSEVEMTRVFVRDGFIDRYTGARLVFPGTLRLLSMLMPAQFPFHPNWKMDACHPAFWELLPTIDHLLPVARGGADEEANWVTTSMLSNARKANWTIEELGWRLHEPGRGDDWDGLVGWFVEYGTAHPDVVAKNDYLRKWLRAAQRVRTPS